MGLLKGKIELWLKWLDACYILKYYIKTNWAKAICCANFILNRVPTKVVMHVTPEEKWNGRKPDISNFKIFGSECWDHISEEK